MFNSFHHICGKAARLMLLAGAVIIVLLTGCTGSSSPAVDILRKDGRYLDEPTVSLGFRLIRASEEERRELVDQLLEIVDSGSGYERLVAIRALMYFSHSAEGKSLLDLNAIEILAENSVRVAQFDPSGATWDDLVLMNVRDWYNTPIDTEFGVEVDGLWVPLDWQEVRPHGRPAGWTIRHARASLNGKVVVDRKDPGGVHWLSHVSLERRIGRGNLIGWHTWRSEVEVVAPSGLSTWVVLERRFEIVSSEESDF